MPVPGDGTNQLPHDAASNPRYYEGLWDPTQNGGAGGYVSKQGTPAGETYMAIKDGSLVTLGNTADAAITGDTAGTVSAKLRGLLKILASVWDNTNNFLKVAGQVANGVAPIGNIFVMGGWDGTLARIFKTDASGVVQTNKAYGDNWQDDGVSAFGTILFPSATTFNIPANNIATSLTIPLGTLLSSSNPWMLSPQSIELGIVNAANVVQLAAPAAPSLSQGTGGTWTAQTAWVMVTYVTPEGETTPSPVASLAVNASGTLTIPSPVAAGDATGWYAYVGTGASQPANGAMYRQQGAGSPTAIGTPLTLNSNPTTTGANPPGANTTGPAGCSISSLTFQFTQTINGVVETLSYVIPLQGSTIPGTTGAPASANGTTLVIPEIQSGVYPTMQLLVGFVQPPDAGTVTIQLAISSQPTKPTIGYFNTPSTVTITDATAHDVVAAAAAGTRNWVQQVQLANVSASATVVTLSDNGVTRAVVPVPANDSRLMTWPGDGLPISQGNTLKAQCSVGVTSVYVTPFVRTRANQGGVA